MMSCFSFMNKREQKEMLTQVTNKFKGKQMYKKMIELLVSDYVQASLNSCGLIINGVPHRKKKMMIKNCNIYFDPYFIYTAYLSLYLFIPW